MHDLIGDIHGHADALERLLNTPGYTRQHGTYRHPDRQAIFLGDFIDRGPKIRETLEIVRPMIESGAALSVMGNHELNALGIAHVWRSAASIPEAAISSFFLAASSCRSVLWLPAYV